VSVLNAKESTALHYTLQNVKKCFSGISFELLYVFSHQNKKRSMRPPSPLSLDPVLQGWFYLHLIPSSCPSSRIFKLACPVLGAQGSSSTCRQFQSAGCPPAFYFTLPTTLAPFATRTCWPPRHDHAFSIMTPHLRSSSDLFEYTSGQVDANLISDMSSIRPNP
jgi:hypothetical protein